MISFVFFILTFAVFLAFIILNLGNASDVSLGFMVLTDVPVFVTALFSFALGMLFVLPLLFSVWRARRLKAARIQAENTQAEGAQTETPRLSDQRTEDARTADSRAADLKVPPPKKSFFGRKTPKKSDFASDEDKIRKENSPYGID